MTNNKQKPLTAEECPKCRTKDFTNCHSIKCPMRKTPIEAIKSVTNCPTCGSECKVVGNTTHHYEPITSQQLEESKREIEELKAKYDKLFFETPQDFIKANIELKNENESLQSELDEVKGEKEDFKLALEQIRTSCNPEESSHELFWHISQGVLTKYTNSEEGKEVKDV